jgi:hypothetical protein
VNLVVEVEHGRETDLWSTRFLDETSMVSKVDGEEEVSRKLQGIALLKQLSENMTKKPILSVFTLGRTTTAEFKLLEDRLPALEMEAKKYGWDVDAVLRRR